jgi:hypothetical protein
MEPNGVFEWERINDNVKCYCKHNQSSHLDNTDICLKGLCICEKFGVDKIEECDKRNGGCEITKTGKGKADNWTYHGNQTSTILATQMLD